MIDKSHGMVTASTTMGKIAKDKSSDSLVKSVQYALFIVQLIQIAILASVLQGASSYTLTEVCQISIVSLIFSVFAAYIFAGRNVWSYSMVYLLVLGLFHFGVVISIGLGWANLGDVVGGRNWLARDTTTPAIIIATLGFASYAGGIGISSIFVRSSRPTSYSGLSKSLAAWPSACLLIVSVITWFGVSVWMGGISILWGSYSNYLLLTEGSKVYSYLWLIMGLSLCLVVISEKSALRTLSLLFFGVFAIFALPLGLRGEVMFGAAAAIVPLARRRKMPSAIVLVLGIIMALFIIGFIKELRQIGISSVFDGNFNPTPAKGLIEMGQSLRPVVEVVTWHAAGEDLASGTTYWAPFDRAICRVLSPQECLPARQDTRLMNVLIYERVGPWGFSTIAEAYRNFGVWGVGVIMAGIGILLGTLSRVVISWRGEVLASVVFFVLLKSVRDAFTAVPAHLVLGTLIITVVVFVASISCTSRRVKLGSFGQHSRLPQFRG